MKKINAILLLLIVVMVSEVEPCFAQKSDSTLNDTCTVYAPNAFSPNDDGMNDVWCVTSNCPIKDFELWIFDRWGNKLWSSKDMKECWDATTKSGDKKTIVEAGVYVWKVTYVDWSGKKCSKVGNLSLIK